MAAYSNLAELVAKCSSLTGQEKLRLALVTNKVLHATLPEEVDDAIMSMGIDTAAEEIIGGPMSALISHKSATLL